MEGFCLSLRNPQFYNSIAINIFHHPRITSFARKISRWRVHPSHCPLPFIQPHFVSDHRDEFTVGRFSPQVVDGIAEVAVEGIHIAPVPRHLNGMADGALHAAGSGTVFMIGNLPNCCEVFSVLHRYRRKLFIVPLLYQMPGHISIDKSLKSDNSKKKSP